jgi:Arc/MetJ-type ribon-helix-helix transcriptional regulator
METVITVRLKGKPAQVLNEMVKKGYSGSKNEAIRTSLIFYAMQLGLISPEMLHKRIKSQIIKKGIRYSEDEVIQQIKAIKND